MGRFGLGHSLLAWARCVVWCKDNNARMLGRRWPRWRIGLYLRRERDKREYFKLFNNAGYIGEPWRCFLLLNARKVAADDVATAPDLATERESTVVIFRNAVGSNFEKYFHEVRGRGAELHQELRRITRQRYLPRELKKPFVAVHVRLGDFSRFDESRVDAGYHNQRLPIHWYRGAVKALREGIGFCVLVRVYSDGENEELTPLLAMPQVCRAEDAELVTHLLEMAGAVPPLYRRVQALACGRRSSDRCRG